MLFDMPLNELEKYLPERNEPHDFDIFWNKTIQDSKTVPLETKLRIVDYGLKLVDTFEVSFRGFGGSEIKAWLVLPKEPKNKVPCVVEFIGYGGGRNFPIDWLLWSNTGYAHFVMDTRGQGSGSKIGSTMDYEPIQTGPHFPGFLTKGILNPATYYYRRVFIDAIRAIDVVKALPQIDSERIAVSGRSQGGGISLAVNGLVQDLSAALIDAPFLCHFRRATVITNEMPYNEIAQYCQNHRDKVETVFNTLDYFVGMNFAVRGNAKALFSVGLMDMICPPSTVFAAYNHFGGKKQISVWSFNQHEAGGSYQKIEQIKLLANLWN